MNINVDPSTISNLTTVVEQKRIELTKLEEAAKAIPQVKEHINYIERTIRILMDGGASVVISSPLDKKSDKEENPPGLGPLPIIDKHTHMNGSAAQRLLEKTIEDRAIEALRELDGRAGSDQLVEKMQANGCDSTKQSILGAIYRAMKKEGGSPIYKVSSGVFGLKENALSAATERAFDE
jgi:hypothetical protein